MAPTRQLDVVVIGAGLLGLSAAAELVGRGRSVRCVERVSVGWERAGSKSSARIFRLSHEDPLYVEMARQALGAWRELEHGWGRPLLVPAPLLSIGDGLGEIAGAMSTAGAPVEAASEAEIVRRFPDVAPGGPGLLEGSAGVLLAGEVLSALRRRCGPGVLAEGERATGVAPAGGGVVVTTTRGELRAGAVVCCAGAFTAEILATVEGVGGVPTWASAQQVAWFRPHGSLEELPAFIERAERVVYGLPDPAAGLYKVGLHDPGRPADAGSVSLERDEAEAAALEGVVRRLFPGLDPEPVVAERCLYDNSPDGDFILDRAGDVVIGAGTSGHGFKFGPLLGKVLADLADGAAPEVPLARFALRRFGSSSAGHGAD